MSNRVNIQISGEPGTGKTTVTQVIKNALELHFKNVEVSCDSGHTIPLPIRIGSLNKTQGFNIKVVEIHH